MTRNDEIVRRLSASKALLAEDFEASKRHIGVVERELENTRHLMKNENATLTAQLKISEFENSTSRKLIEFLEKEKAEAVMKLQESQQHSQQQRIENESLEKQADGTKRPSLQMNSDKAVSEAQLEVMSKKTSAEKEVEACQRQVVKIKNEKSVLELELLVSKRQIEDLKARIPKTVERPERPHSSPHGAIPISKNAT